MRARGSRPGISAIGGMLLLGALGLVPSSASASGGGGCGRPVTDASGTTVDIRDSCFSPTILRVGTGEVVTFTNVDAIPHSVLGANATWGDYAGFRKQPVTFRFSEPGVYPYVCTYHVGMVGVVVVGDGAGGAIGTPTKDGPVTRVDASDLALENTAAVARPGRSEASGAWPVIVAAMFGVAVGALATVVVRRRRGSGPGGRSKVGSLAE
jgi:plastocyanin